MTPRTPKSMTVVRCRGPEFAARIAARSEPGPPSRRLVTTTSRIGGPVVAARAGGAGTGAGAWAGAGAEAAAGPVGVTSRARLTAKANILACSQWLATSAEARATGRVCR